MMSRVHKALIRRGLIPRAFSEVTLTAGGRAFRAPVVDGRHCEIAEPWMAGLLRVMLARRAGAFVDVGVNVGQTLLVVKAIEPRRDYVGFEPNALCLAYSERLVELNRLEHVTLVPAAIGTATGLARLQLYVQDGTDTSASLVAGFRPDERVVRVKLVPVFAYDDAATAAGIGRIGIVKIDVEGAESDVILSMERAIARDRPWIAVEILPCYRADNADRIARQGAIEALLKRLGYVLLRVVKSAGEQFEGLEPVGEIGVHGDIRRADYVACGREDEQALRAAAPVRGAA